MIDDEQVSIYILYSNELMMMMMMMMMSITMMVTILLLMLLITNDRLMTTTLKYNSIECCPFHQKRRTINPLTLITALPLCFKREERREKIEERREKS
jgi:hypothetical protein